MDFDDTFEEAAFRAEARAWLTEHAVPKGHPDDFSRSFFDPDADWDELVVRCTAPARGHAFELVARVASPLRANAVTVEAGDHVWAHAGVVHGFVRGEMNDLASGAGYRVVWERAEPYGHALLTPSATSPWGGSWPAPGRSP